MYYEDFGAEFSPDRRYRYKLWRTWDFEEKKCAFIMLNPSGADEHYDDPTILRCVGYARSWGYGSLIVGNLFALVSTDPEDLFSSECDKTGPDNDRFLREIDDECDLTVVAWGNHGGYMNRDVEVLKILKDPHYLRITKFARKPQHPLYLPKDLIPMSLASKDL